MQSLDGPRPTMTIDQLKKQILTHEQYRDHPFAKSEKRTYAFALEKGSKRLVFFGSSHVYDPKDPMFTEIRRLFEQEKPEIVYVEGWRAINDHPDETRTEMANTTSDEAARDGESHFTLKLAVDAGSNFESPEPQNRDEIEYLVTQGFSHEEIYNFYAYRQISQFQQQQKGATPDQCKQYMARYLDRFASDSSWNKEELGEYEKKLFAKLDLENKKYRHETDPIPWEDNPQTTLNELSRASSIFRDHYIFERIAEGLKTHDRIFIVYGSAHAVVQEPALRALFESL